MNQASLWVGRTRCRLSSPLTYLHQAGNDKVRDVLKVFTEAILNDRSMTENQKNKLIEQIAFLSEQTALSMPTTHESLKSRWGNLKVSVRSHTIGAAPRC
jgi:hypothetical protein